VVEYSGFVFGSIKGFGVLLRGDLGLVVDGVGGESEVDADLDSEVEAL